MLLACLSLVLLTGCSQKSKLKLAIELADKQCPMDMGTVGEISGITFDGTDVIYNMLMNEDYLDLNALEKNPDRHEEGADPAAVVFDAVKAAIARNVDVLFIDTAGRLHNKTNLMNELEKVHRIIKREIPEAPHETFLVLDATTGQNAINQAKVFMETANVTGVVLTKLDGTAKGGVVIAIKEELSLPVKWIGVGEGIMDFRPFEADKFVDALFDGDK